MEHVGIGFVTLHYRELVDIRGFCLMRTGFSGIEEPGNLCRHHAGAYTQ